MTNLLMLPYYPANTPEYDRIRHRIRYNKKIKTTHIKMGIRSGYKKEFRNNHKKEISLWSKKYNSKLKRSVYNHYGSKCVCCGEKDQRFLTLDHKYNNGGHHRKKVGAGTKTYRWLIKNNFPPIIQILCWNCNCGKMMNNGICPHRSPYKIEYN